MKKNCSGGYYPSVMEKACRGQLAPLHCNAHRRPEIKRVLSLFLVFAMLAAFMPVIHAATITDSGTCGDNLTWTLDSDFTLTISGTGDMTDWRSSDFVPWKSSRSSIKSVIIENGVTSISFCAFFCCSSLESIEIPGNVTSIGNSAFSHCSNLTSVTICNGVTSIGGYAFEYCSSLTSIVIPDSVTSIGNLAFSYCSSLMNIDVSPNNSTFSSVDGILFNKDKTELICFPTGKSGSYTIPSSVTSIGNGAFYYCSSLESIVIPDSVTSIGGYAFEYCSSLKSIVIPDSVTSIGNSVFEDCSSVESVTIGNSVTSIGNEAFRSCSSLESIEIPDSVTSIGDDAFRSCSRLESVTIGNSVTSIGDRAFIYCRSLTSIEIPDSVTSIGYSAFYYCSSVESVTIGNSVTSISDEAFDACYGLTDVYYGGSEEEWNNISIRSGNTYLTKATIHYNSTGGGTVTPQPTETFAPDVSTPAPSNGFQVNKYRAEFLLNDTLGNTMENTYFDFDSTPSRILYQAGIDSGLYNSDMLWETLTDTIDAVDSPSNLLDYAIEEKDVYSAIIFSMFESATDYKVMDCIDNEVTKGTKNLVSTVTSAMKNLYNYDMPDGLDISKLDDKGKENLKNAVNMAYEQEHGYIAAGAGLTNVISKGIEYAKDLESYCEMVETYYNIWCLSGSMKKVLKEMRDRCPITEPALKTALSECVVVMNSSENAFAAEMAAVFFGVAGKDVTHFLIDKMWDEVKNTLYMAHPGAYVLMSAYKVGKYASSALYNSDDITEKYFKLAAIVKAEGLMDTVYSSLKTKYQSAKTEEKAEIYNSAVDVMFNTLNTDCDYAYSFADSVGSEAMGKLDAALGDTSVADIKSSISSIQDSYYNFHESVLTAWINELEADDYELYTEYAYLLDKSYERIKKRYNISHPVDVYIYNSDGVLEGSVINNIPYCSDNKNITVAVNGDAKTIYFYDDEEYNIVYAGNDTGTMDIAISEYDDTSAVTRSVYFNGLELTDGLTYSSTESSSAEEYVIVDDSGNNINADYDTQNADDTTYTAALTRGYFSDFSLSAELHAGENAEITAYVPEGYKFIGWTSDAGEDIFADASSTSTTIRMPAYDVNITANIERPRLSITDITDSSVTVEAIACDDVDNGTVILAVYDSDGVLKDVFTQDFAKTVTFDNLDLTGCTVKAMLWGNLSEMKPLAEVM